MAQLLEGSVHARAQIALSRLDRRRLLGARIIFGECGGARAQPFHIGVADILPQRLAYELGAGAMLASANAIELFRHRGRQGNG
jgi:hypothetical protein